VIQLGVNTRTYEKKAFLLSTVLFAVTKTMLHVSEADKKRDAVYDPDGAAFHSDRIKPAGKPMEVWPTNRRWTV